MLVFLSSTVAGHEDRRLVLSEAIRSAGHTPILSEDPSFPVRPGSHVHDACLEAVCKCDAIVALLQREAGQPYDGKRAEYRGMTLCEAEYREAVRAKKPVIALADRLLPEQRRLHLAGTAPAGLMVPQELLEFYSSVVGCEWVDFFANTAEARNAVASRLAHPKPYDHVNRRRRFGLTPPDGLPGALDVLSQWRCYCPDFSSVKKEWTLRFTNLSPVPFEIRDRLAYPVQHEDVALLSSRFWLETAAGRTALQAETSVGRMGNMPVVTLAPKMAVVVPPGGILGFTVTMTHGNYFSKTGKAQWVHRGRLFFMDYEGFRGHSIVQRVTKEYWIEKSLLIQEGDGLHVTGEPPFDWTMERKHHWVYGYGRCFEIGGNVIEALIIEQ
jgi:hypothetical protein